MASSEPLSNFSATRTTDPDVVCEALSRLYAAPTLRLSPGVKAVNARLNEFQLANIKLAYGTYGTTVHLDFPAVDSFMHLFPVHGYGEVISGKQTAVLSGGKSYAIISPDAGYEGHYRHDYGHLALKIEAHALTNKLAVMTGATLNKPLRVGLQPAGAHHSSILCRYMRVLADLLNDSVAPLPPWWVSQTEQLLMIMFLCGYQHNYSHLLEQEAPDAAPSQVRKAEDYIEENCRQAITLEDLATVTGVSGFSLFRSFRKIRGYSPFEFASRLRSGGIRRQR